MIMVDLTQPLYDQMPVYPGDPEVKIQPFLTLAKDGWNVNMLSFPSHIGTHMNVPAHAVEGGKTLDDYDLSAYCGKAMVYETGGDIRSGVGFIFESAASAVGTLSQIISTKTPFIGVGGYFESPEELETEKELLRQGIISYEGLVNLDQLPRSGEFMFYGMPVKIKNGDGSPVRAFAVIHE